MEADEPEGRVGVGSAPARPREAADEPEGRTRFLPDVSQRVAVPGERVTWREEHGRVVLERPATGARRLLLRLARQPVVLTVRLDEVGSAAWRLVDGQRTVGAIHDGLARQFPAEAGLAARLGRFVGAMVSRGLLRLR